MNIVALREAKSKLTEVGKAVQKGGRALITRRGKPFVVMLGVEGEDLLEVLLRWDPAFWRDLERRRNRSRARSVSLAEFQREVGISSAKTPPRGARPGTRRARARRPG